VNRDWNGSKKGHVYKFLRSQGFISSYDIAHNYKDETEDSQKVLWLIPFFVILGSHSVGKMLECLLNSGSVTAITEETSAEWTSYGSKIRRKSRNP